MKANDMYKAGCTLTGCGCLLILGAPFIVGIIAWICSVLGIG